MDNITIYRIDTLLVEEFLKLLEEDRNKKNIR